MFDYLDYKNRIPLDKCTRGKIPKLNPYSQKYKNYWKQAKRDIIEGYWIEHEGEYKWLPPVLALYNNFWTIEMSKKGSKSQNKIKGTPRLRDIEWIKGYVWATIRGFSGFENDDKYTSNRILISDNKDEYISYAEDHILKSIYNSKGELKEYVPALEYLYKYYDKNLGKPQFYNSALNLADIECRNIGKDLRWNSLIYKESGYDIIDNIKIGDKIYDHTGKLTIVLDRKDFNNQLQYEIIFQDGRKVECGGGHLWGVYDRGVYKVKELKELYNSNYKTIKTNNYPEYRYRIPLTRAINFNNKELPLEPYYLGLWLGDGTSDRSDITTVDQEIVDYLYEYAKKLNQNVTKIKSNTKGKASTYSITNGFSGGKPSNILNKLRELNLINNKHIPDIYLYSSIEDRLSLLQGLMDSDGCVYKNGYSEFSNKNIKIITDFKYLCHSLGIRISDQERYTSFNNKKYLSYRVRLNTDLPIVRLSRKLERLKCTTNKKVKTSRTSVAIVDIKPLKIDRSVCIKVDNADHLFLTDNFIVTHNSMFGGCAVGHNFLTDGSMDYEELMSLREEGNEPMSETLVGAIDSKYSTGLINKLKLGLDELPGAIEIGDMMFPAPLYKKYSGSLMSGKHIEAIYDKKIGNNWTKCGSKSRILHRSFADNPFAANGTRPGFNLIDEIGFMGNLLETLGQMAECTTTDGRKFGSIWMTGCVCAGTKVWDKEGNLLNIEDLKVEDGIYGFNKIYGTAVANSINFIKEPAKKNCFRITTNTMRTIECSEDHPILWSQKDFGSKPRIKGSDKRLFFKNTTYVETKDIIIGDQIAVIDKVDKFSDKILWEARLVGMLIGDGSYGYNKTPILSNCAYEINNYIDERYNTVIEKSYITKKGDLYRETRIKGICKNLRDIGIYGQTKSNKTLPLNIHSYSKRSICELLAGLFDTDGCIYINKQNTKGSIQLSAAYFNLLDEIRLLLQKLGIHCTINFCKPNFKNPIDRDGYYRLTINDARSIVNFYENISLLINYKKDKLKDLYNIYKEAPIRKSKNVEGIRFERVVNIENIGEQYVYNLNAALTHSYLANGIITHNTGGDMISGATEAIKKVFYDPAAYDCLEFDDIFENKGKIGFFVPAWMALDEFRDEFGNVNKELAVKKLLREREIAKNAKSKQKLYSLLQMKPLVPSEAFLVLEGNIFPVGELKEHLANLESTERKKDLGTIGWMHRDTEGKAIFKPDDDLIPADYPTKESQTGKSAVVIWEQPEDNNAYGQYVAGIDPYDQDAAESSVSYGSIFIYKRYIIGNSIYKLPVAEYTGRPEFANDFYEQCRRLLEYYNCQALYENQNPGLKKYFETKFCTHLLHTQPNIIKNISPNSKVNRTYGIHMTTPIKDELEIMCRDWLKEELEPGVMQLTKICSIPLLKEMISYNSEGNFDRVIAFMLCILQDIEMHKITMDDNKSEDDGIDSFFKKSLFTNKVLKYQN